MSIEKTHLKTSKPIYCEENIKYVEVQEAQVHPKALRKEKYDLMSKDKGLVSNKEDLGGPREAFVSGNSKDDELAHEVFPLFSCLCLNLHIFSRHLENHLHYALNIK